MPEIETFLIEKNPSIHNTSYLREVFVVDIQAGLPARFLKRSTFPVSQWLPDLQVPYGGGTAQAHPVSLFVQSAALQPIYGIQLCGAVP
jgi:hypothetical protein